jgi:hypothetical protein
MFLLVLSVDNVLLSRTFLVMVTVSQPFVPVLLSEEFEFEIEFEYDLEVSQPSQCFKLKVSSTAH